MNRSLLVLCALVGAMFGQPAPKKPASTPLKEYSYPAALSIRLKVDPNLPCDAALEKLKKIANVPIREFTVSGRPAWEEKEWRRGDSMVFERYVCGIDRYYLLTLGWPVGESRPQLGVEIMDSFRLVK